MKFTASIFLSCTLLLSSVGCSASFFTAEKDCELYSSVPKQENISNVKTVIGKKYEVVSGGKNYPTNIHVKVTGEYPEDRWVRKSCGVMNSDNESTPFFTMDSLEPGQARYPNITELDQLALEKCGNWGKEVGQKDLEDLFSGSALQYIFEELDHTVITKNANIDTFKKELIGIWLKNTAFEHVICGEPSAKKLGGLHYVGRYLDLQNKGWGGLNESCQRENVKNPIYTIGVDFLDSYGDLATKCPSGYNYNMTVADIIIEGTKAFKELPDTTHKTIECTYSSLGVDYTFVARNNTIVTFYSTLTPPHNQKLCSDF